MANKPRCVAVPNGIGKKSVKGRIKKDWSESRPVYGLGKVH